jgi:hypothetical protein
MPVFTKPELAERLRGHIDDLTDGEYQQAHDFAVALVDAYTTARYRETEDGERIRKQLALELGATDVGLKRFDEQSPQGVIFLERRARLMEVLKDIASGVAELDVTARSDEPEEYPVKVLGVSGESLFPDTFWERA